MAKLNLEIITPSRVVYRNNQVISLNVPSATGYLGILPNHTSLFAKLIEGEIKIALGQEEVYLSIGGGFIEVNKNEVRILVTRAVHADELNRKEVEEALARAKELLKTKPTGSALLEAQSLYRRSLIDLKLMERRRRIYSKKTSFDKNVSSI